MLRYTQRNSISGDVRTRYKRAYASFKEMKKTKDLRFNMVKTRITAINASASQKEKECPWMWKAFWMPVKKSGVTAVPR